MTTTQIAKRAEQEMKKFEVAKQIRELLDQARKLYGDEEADDVEAEILELVTEE